MKTASYIQLRFVIVTLLMMLGMAACFDGSPTDTSNQPAEWKSQPPVNPFPNVDANQVERLLEAMTLEEKIGQLIIWSPENIDDSFSETAIQQVRHGSIGGLILPQMDIDAFLHLTDIARRSAPITLFLGTDQKVSLHGQFHGTPKFPNPLSISAIDSVELREFLENELIKQSSALGVNFAINPSLPASSNSTKFVHPNQFEQEADALLVHAEKMVGKLKSNRILSIADGFNASHIEVNDSLRAAHLYDAQRFITSGVQGVLFEENIFNEDWLLTNHDDFLANYLSYKLDFRGLNIAKIPQGQSPALHLSLGSDLIITSDAGQALAITEKLLSTGRITERELNKRVRKILTAKAWMNGGKLPVQFSVFPRDSVKQMVQLVSVTNKDVPRIIGQVAQQPADFLEKTDKLRSYFTDPVWEYFSQTLFESSTTLAIDVNKLLPFKSILEKDFKVFEFGGSNFTKFRYAFSKYADFETINLGLTDEGALPFVHLGNPGHYPVSVILIDSVAINPVQDRFFIESINEMSQSAEVIIVNFGSPLNLGFFEQNITFLQVYERNHWTESYAAQAMFGGVSVNGKLPITVNKHLPFGASEFISKCRLGYNTSYKVGIAPERLVGIDAIAKSAIQNGVFPGCQVVIAKNGEVVYSNAFGHHTYSKEKAVSTNDMYDIASISKVAGTTLAVMKLVEDDQLQIGNNIGEYAGLDHSSSVASIKIKDLLTHRSGLQAPMPIGRFFNYRSVPRVGCNDIFCHEEDDSYNIQIADDLFFRGDYRDTIWKRVNRLTVSSRRGFQYSDVNFYLLQKAVENLSRSNLDDLLYAQFYEPLGLRRFMFNPMNQYDLQSIVPTEIDRLWRKTLVHGFVHDPTAALMGGVGGNAGLFSNAEDLAALFQMLVSEGKYGGVQYFEAKTIEEFTSAKHGGHRGLGFDKPTDKRYPTFADQSPASTYGHTGFTGTCVWADPENDLIYVFLSNRIHPTSRNKKIFTEGVRQRIHEVAYDALESFDPTLPSLDSK